MEIFSGKVLKIEKLETPWFRFRFRPGPGMMQSSDCWNRNPVYKCLIFFKRAV
jgi:hypothetical protein